MKEKGDQWMCCQCNHIQVVCGDEACNFDNFNVKCSSCNHKYCDTCQYLNATEVKVGKKGKTVKNRTDNSCLCLCIIT